VYSVGTMTKVKAEKLSKCGLVPGKYTRDLSSPKYPEWP